MFAASGSEPPTRASRRNVHHGRLPNLRHPRTQARRTTHRFSTLISRRFYFLPLAFVRPALKSARTVPGEGRVRGSKGLPGRFGWGLCDAETFGAQARAREDICAYLRLRRRLYFKMIFWKKFYPERAFGSSS